MFNLKPRISNIFLLANECIKKGLIGPKNDSRLKSLVNDKTFLAVYFQMSHYYFTFEKETYGKIRFLINSDENPVFANNKYLCIESSSKYSQVFFLTDGKKMYEVFEYNPCIEKKMTSDTFLIQDFLNDFDNFETDFYDWIDSIQNNEKGVHNEKS